MKWRTALISIVAAGCMSTYGETFTTPTMMSVDDAFSCVTNELGKMGYTIKDGDREAGFVQAEKPESSGVSMATAEPVFPTMEISITESQDGRTLRVTATTLDDESEVDRLMEACGDG